MAEPFRFEYTMPSLDWYEIIKKTVSPDDYDYFELQLRYGPCWWLVGHKIDSEWNNSAKEIGRLSRRDAVRFIEWAKCKPHGSNLVEISAISSSLDLIGEISKISELVEEMKDG